MRVFIYEHPKTGDVFTVPDPNLQLNQLEEVQRQVAHLMEHGLDAPASAALAETTPLVEASASASPAGDAASA
ncbi:MAG: hypothetical protein HY300_14985 [Verrucomicrobia bacterium]|nr:hypothetical protein [Verrucomicrobiota bacterium]